MYYKKDSIIMNYLKRFYESNLFMALLVAMLVAMLYFGLLRATALSVQPSQDSGKTLQVAVPAKGVNAPLQVQPVPVTKLSQVSTPSDIQPVTIPDVLQSTANPQK